MRFLAHLLVGLPLLGLLSGAGLFLYDAVANFTQGPQEWAPCSRFLQWLFKKWNIWDTMASFTNMYCDLSPGAHLALASMLAGFVLVPLGLWLARLSQRS